MQEKHVIRDTYENLVKIDRWSFYPNEISHVRIFPKIVHVHKEKYTRNKCKRFNNLVKI